MARKIKVLVVDDAVVVRRLVGELLTRDPEIDVVGTAATGRIALQKLAQLSPDVVTLDVDMPEMDGLETLRAIRKTHPRLPVIMFSALTARAAAATLEALSYGASDYLCKPAIGLPSDGRARSELLSELIQKIRALCPHASPPVSEPVTAHARRVVPSLRREERTRPVSVLAIGVSTGGPKALAAIIPALPITIGVPIVIVQHMPPMFTKLLAGRLDSQSALRVIEAQGGETLTAGTVYIAPGNSHLILERHGSDVVIALDQGAPENSCRPSVDVLFRSVASVFGSGALGLVLTGMGQDGLAGSAALARARGHVIVQDEESSVVWGMPGLIAKAGLANRVLPLHEIAGEIVRWTPHHPGATRSGTLRPGS